MINRKPKVIRADVDDRKLAVIEHLTGERLERKSKLDQRFERGPQAVAALTVIAVLCLTIILSASGTPAF